MKKGLVIKEKWLDKIFDEGKVWEMRTSSTKIRGTIGLIQSGSGLIIGKADIIDSFRINLNERNFDKHRVDIDDLHLLGKWRYAWVLDNVEKFDEPIPYKHPQGAVIWVKL